MVKAVTSLIEFCYLVRRNVIDETTLEQIQSTVDRFHHYREIFREVGIRPDGFSLPWQHSISHYKYMITQFGAPNGLCSSITESMHIRAVKRPYRRSGRNQPLGQILITNQRIDKLAAAQRHFPMQGMLNNDPRSSANALNTNVGMPNGAVGERERHDSQVDDPDVVAEISLSKRRGAYCNYLWACHCSYRFIVPA